MGKSISIHTVLKTLVMEKEWYQIYIGPENLKSVILSYVEFDMLMQLNDISTYDRKIKALWETLSDIGVGKKANKSSMTIDQNAVRCILVKYNKIDSEDIAWANQKSMEQRIAESKSESTTEGLA